jgi:GT2 family glycosyltransferase
MKLLRFFWVLLLFVLSPVLLVLSAATLAVVDAGFGLLGRKRLPSVFPARHDCASVVIPNWNGRDLLEKYLPSVVAALTGHPENEIIVVDNASKDGSAEFLERHFPQVRVIRCEKNLGFGGGSNRGFREARNDVVVLLNSDMRVDPSFLGPLLAPFDDPQVFAVACQIFFSDPAKRREETGLTRGWWGQGRIRVAHRLEQDLGDAFPCFYAGGGSSAYDRRKFLELGGFDEVLKPFYYEDTDLGLMAWKRGWKVFYQPRSVVFHEHRGTIGRKFSARYIQSILKKNAVLFVWKDIHRWPWLGSHFVYLFASSFRSMLAGDAPGAFSFPGLAKAFLQLPALCRSRWRARTLAVVSDQEAFRRPLGAYFRDRFEVERESVPERLRVLFAAPYPIEPPVHGGAVFMKLTLEELAPLADVHLAGMVDIPDQLPDQAPLRNFCSSVYMQVRRSRSLRSLATLQPHAVREFADPDFAWALHCIAFAKKIDVIQLEYTQFAQYAGDYRFIPVFLFEHDIHFQSVERLVGQQPQWWRRALYAYEYLRSLRYELKVLPRFTRIQACSSENANALIEFLPGLKTRIDSNLRAGIQTKRFPFIDQGREPNTMLFVGSFRHDPNVDALRWFVSQVLPRVTVAIPEARLVIVGSDPPPSLSFLARHPNVRFTGYVPDVREPLGRCSVFVCPVLTGSGIRVKLLEAFASGIPTVSTYLGAEGLATRTGEICELAANPLEFAEAVVRLLREPDYAASLARRARAVVEASMDAEVITGRLERVFRGEVMSLRKSTPAGVGKVGFSPRGSFRPAKSLAALKRCAD